MSSPHCMPSKTHFLAYFDNFLTFFGVNGLFWTLVGKEHCSLSGCHLVINPDEYQNEKMEKIKNFEFLELHEMHFAPGSRSHR